MDTERTYEIYTPRTGTLQCRLVDHPDSQWRTHLDIIGGWDGGSFPMSVVMYGSIRNTVVSGWAFYNYDDNTIIWEHPRSGNEYVFSPKRAWMDYSHELRMDLADPKKDYCSAIFYDVAPDEELTAIVRRY